MRIRTLSMMALGAALLAAAGSGLASFRTVAAERKLIFVTPTPSTAGFVGGLSGADLRCREAAEAAGLEGTFLAWLGDGFIGPSDRFAEHGRRYVNVAGEEVAGGWSDLVDGSLAAPVLDLDGRTPRVAPWTNLGLRGRSGDLSTGCGRWWSSAREARGTYGDPALWFDARWLRAGTSRCDVPRPFYCVED